MLTVLEREFMDLYVRASFNHDYDSYAMVESRRRGITYDHYNKLYPVYHETWKAIGEWPDHLPPIQANPTPPCPWATKEELEARIQFLQAEITD